MKLAKLYATDMLIITTHCGMIRVCRHVQWGSETMPMFNAVRVDTLTASSEYLTLMADSSDFNESFTESNFIGLAISRLSSMLQREPRVLTDLAKQYMAIPEIREVNREISALYTAQYLL